VREIRDEGKVSPGSGREFASVVYIQVRNVPEGAVREVGRQVFEQTVNGH
jgi:hypothetical protein